MTGRGPNANPVPSLPGPDPTLQTGPVPRERHFDVRFFGPGADPDLDQHVRSIEELDQQLADSGFQGEIRNPRDWGDEITRSFVKEVISEGNTDYHDLGFDFVPSHTWELYIMVTAYSESAQENLESAVYKLVETVRRCFLGNTTPPFRAYGEEAFGRFRLGVIQDKRALGDASDDRIREEYNAYIRTLNMHIDDWEEGQSRRYQDGLNRPYAPHGLDPCIVFDEATIEQLSTLTFPDDLEKDRDALADVTVKMVDRCWRYPQKASDEAAYGPRGGRTYYAGVDYCPVYDLPYIRHRMEGHGGMPEMFPLKTYLDDH